MYQLQIQALSIEEFQQKVIALATKFQTEDKLPAQISFSTPTMSTTVDELKPAPSKRGPKAKAVKSPAEVMDILSQETQSAELPSQAELAPATVVEEIKSYITQEMLTEALRGVNKRRGFDSLRPTLGKFKNAAGKNCQRLSEIQEKDFAAFIKHCDAQV